MKRIGCRPPYWDMQAAIPNCTSNDQLISLGRKIIVYLAIFLKLFGGKDRRGNKGRYYNHPHPCIKNQKSETLCTQEQVYHRERTILFHKH
jgi:hypothetical protein